MCDDFMDDFDREYEDDLDGEGFENEAYDHGGNDQFEDVFDFDWQDWMIIGPLSEEIAREKWKRRRIKY